MKRIFGALMVIGLCLSMAIVTYARDFSEEQRELYGQYVEIVESISKKYEALVTSFVIFLNKEVKNEIS